MEIKFRELFRRRESRVKETHRRASARTDRCRVFRDPSIRGAVAVTTGELQTLHQRLLSRNLGVLNDRQLLAASCQRDEGPPGGRSLVALSLSATLPCDACSTPRRLDGSPRARSA